MGKNPATSLKESLEAVDKNLHATVELIEVESSALSNFRKFRIQKQGRPAVTIEIGTKKFFEPDLRNEISQLSRNIIQATVKSDKDSLSAVVETSRRAWETFLMGHREFRRNEVLKQELSRVLDDAESCINYAPEHGFIPGVDTLKENMAKISSERKEFDKKGINLIYATLAP